MNNAIIKSRLQRITTGCLLILIAALAFCPLSFALTPDCDNALKDCRAYCNSNLQIYDRERFDYVKQSDFSKYCERSCNEGFKSCQSQDTYSSCGTFFFHCAGTCPWTIHDTYSGISYEISETDAFNQCQQACGAGGKSCQQISTPPRNRSAEFDACKEGQSSCYSNCMESSDPTFNPGNFPDLCAKACFEGVGRCQNEKGGKDLSSCYEFYYGCTE